MSEKVPPHLRLIDAENVIVQLQWEFRDCWVGVFWRKTDLAVHLYICLIPCVPLHVTIMRKKWRGWRLFGRGASHERDG